MTTELSYLLLGLGLGLCLGALFTLSCVVSLYVYARNSLSKNLECS